MKYINALRYGSRETKLYIWSVLIGSLLTIVTLVYAVGKRSWIGGLAALFFGIVTLIIWQSKSLSDQEVEEPEEAEALKRADAPKGLEETEKLEEPEDWEETEFEPYLDLDAKQEIEQNKGKKGEKKKKEKKKKEKKEKAKKEKTKKEKGKKEKEKKQAKEIKGNKEESKAGEPEPVPAGLEVAEEEELELTLGKAETQKKETRTSEEKTPDKPEPAKEEQVVSDYNAYSEASLKKALHRYRVKREHKQVMIDSCPSKGIRECPAYLWKDRHKVYLLLLEKTPRRIEYPLEKMNFLEYQRGVEANPDQEYPAFQKKSPVTAVFSAFLPDYYQRRKNGVISDLKNLYLMAGDLAFTNTSVKNVMDVLHPGFRVKDNVTSSSLYGAYFIESYQQNILLRDRVLEVDEYKERMKVLLQKMAQEERNLREFRHKLEELVEYRFITEEFADYFLEYRARLDLARAEQK